MSLFQVCVVGTCSLAVFKGLQLLLRKSHSFDLDGPDKGHWLLGNVTKLFEGGIEYCVDIVDRYGGAVRLHGPYGELVYLADPRALYHMVVKDQQMFEETDDFIMSNKLIFGNGLVGTVGEQHRRQRKLLSPLFSTTNMRRLLPTLHPIAEKLASTLVAKLPADGSQKEIDVLPWLSRCALDGICQCILGYPSNSLSAGDDEGDEYVEALRNLGPLISNLQMLRRFVVLVNRYCSPYWATKVLDLVTAPWLPTQLMRDVRELRRIVETMDSASRREFAVKKAAAEADDELCEDSRMPPSMMDIMLKANSVTSNTDQLTDAELFGQMNVMVFAGLDTTTAALARCIYLLAMNPHIQARLRSEIRDAMKSSEHQDEDDATPFAGLSYEILDNLPFLDGVVKETLRLYPSFPFMLRKTTKATTLPVHFPVRTRAGVETSTITMPQGSHAIISILAANRHKEIWGPDANEWIPERWLAEEQGRSAPTLGVKDGVRFPAVYSNMMTFLSGNRSCVGFKFAEMEMKKVLATLLVRLHFALPTDKEIQWKLWAFHVPVVKPPAGDGVTQQVPLNVRLAREEDFKW
ncbi:cytochrome P450 [Suillus paluster]|uniref:cytochrome P450 n=1 Tax=Suillus paluster TaxID=48578 RepID=UPI001B87D3F7|nr:cytochrome P450 [Suillus paluster]KAG1739086.1 cytochrome P450 [Suillus paluster]